MTPNTPIRPTNVCEASCSGTPGKVNTPLTRPPCSRSIRNVNHTPNRPVGASARASTASKRRTISALESNPNELHESSQPCKFLKNNSGGNSIYEENDAVDKSILKSDLDSSINSSMLSTKGRKPNQNSSNRSKRKQNNRPQTPSPLKFASVNLGKMMESTEVELEAAFRDVAIALSASKKSKSAKKIGLIDSNTKPPVNVIGYAKFDDKGTSSELQSVGSHHHPKIKKPNVKAMKSLMDCVSSIESSSTNAVQVSHVNISTGVFLAEGDYGVIDLGNSPTAASVTSEITIPFSADEGDKYLKVKIPLTRTRLFPGSHQEISSKMEALHLSGAESYNDEDGENIEPQIGEKKEIPIGEKNNQSFQGTAPFTSPLNAASLLKKAFYGNLNKAEGTVASQAECNTMSNSVQKAKSSILSRFTCSVLAASSLASYNQMKDESDEEPNTPKKGPSIRKTEISLLELGKGIESMIDSKDASPTDMHLSMSHSSNETCSVDQTQIDNEESDWDDNIDSFLSDDGSYNDDDDPTIYSSDNYTAPGIDDIEDDVKIKDDPQTKMPFSVRLPLSVSQSIVGLLSVDHSRTDSEDYGYHDDDQSNSSEDGSFHQCDDPTASTCENYDQSVATNGNTTHGELSEATGSYSCDEDEDGSAVCEDVPLSTPEREKWNDWDIKDINSQGSEQDEVSKPDTYTLELLSQGIALSALGSSENVEKEERDNTHGSEASIPPVLSTSDEELQCDNTTKLFALLSNGGLEILKLNRERKWQPRFLTITQEFMWFKKTDGVSCSKNESCPIGILWTKKSQSNAGSFESTGKNGKGGLLFASIESVSVMRDNYALNRRQKKGRFKDSYTFVLHSRTNRKKRDVLFRCMTKEDVLTLSAGFQAIIDQNKNNVQSSPISVRLPLGNISSSALNSMQKLGSPVALKKNISSNSLIGKVPFDMRDS